MNSKKKQTDLVKDYGFPDFKKKELKFGKNEENKTDSK